MSSPIPGAALWWHHYRRWHPVIWISTSYHHAGQSLLYRWMMESRVGVEDFSDATNEHVCGRLDWCENGKHDYMRDRQKRPWPLHTVVSLLCAVHIFHTGVDVPCFKALNGKVTRLPAPCSVMGCCFPVTGTDLRCCKVWLQVLPFVLTITRWGALL